METLTEVDATVTTIVTAKAAPRGAEGATPFSEDAETFGGRVEALGRSRGVDGGHGHGKGISSGDGGADGRRHRKHGRRRRGKRRERGDVLEGRRLRSKRDLGGLRRVICGVGGFSTFLLRGSKNRGGGARGPVLDAFGNRRGARGRVRQGHAFGGQPLSARRNLGELGGVI